MKDILLNFKKIIVLIAVSFVFFSTEAQVRKDDIVKINLSLSQNYLELESSGGSRNITVTTNASSWTVSGNSDWCSVSKSGNLFTISSNANPNNYERNATFTVKADKETATVSVKQKAKPVPPPTPQENLSLSTTELFFDAEGGTKTVYVYGVSSYTTSGVYAWCKKSQYSTYFTITCEANTTTSERKDDTFYVKAGNKEIKVIIKQKGKIENNLSLSTTELLFDAEGGTKTVYVYGVSSYTTSGVYAWCKKSQYSTYFTITCEANTTTSERKDDTFYVKGGDKEIKVIIKQKGKIVVATALEKGEWRNLINKVVTNVTKSYDNGAKYKGEYSNGSRTGLGMMYWSDSKDSYWGEYYNGDRNGQGIYIAGNNNRHINNCSNCVYFVGAWKSGEKFGQGYCYDQIGKMIYAGDFKDDKPTGTYPNNYKDEYKFESLDYSDGHKYIGETQNGKAHGLGIYFWTDGQAWFGEWREGRRKGSGIHFYYDGSIKTGKWDDNTYLGN